MRGFVGLEKQIYVGIRSLVCAYAINVADFFQIESLILAQNER